MSPSTSRMVGGTRRAGGTPLKQSRKARVVSSSAPLVPKALTRLMSGRPAESALSGDAWLANLPRLIDDALTRWDLSVDGDPRHGPRALVLPVRRADGTPAALKVGWPHEESAHEHLALRAWNGQGAVRLLAANPASTTMLLAWLGPTDLHAQPIDEAFTTIGELLRRLRRPALPQLRRCSALAQRFLDTPPHRSLPRRFTDQAHSLARDLAGGERDTHLLHTDLHCGNVLADPDGHGWHAIGPKPLAGEPAYEVWPALHNRWSEIEGDATWAVSCRLQWICDAAGIDEDRARAWAMVRTVSAAARDAAQGRDITRWITVLKALQPGW